jgi:regulator of replication initiation timing
MAKSFNQLREEAEAQDQASIPQHTKNLPTSDSDAESTQPDSTEKLNQESDPMSKDDALLPTHSSDAAAEVPEDEDQAAPAANQSADPEFDGDKIVDGAAKDGVQKAVKEEAEEEMDEEEEEMDETTVTFDDPVDGQGLPVEKSKPVDAQELGEEEEVEEEEEMDEEEEEEMKEHINALTSGLQLSEEYQAKAATLFETAIKAHSKKVTKRLNRQFENKVVGKVQSEVERIVDHVDRYLDYVVENWIKDNEVAVEAGLRSEITENLINGFKKLCEESNVEIPEEEKDVVGEKEKEVEELSDELDKEVEENIKLRKELNSLKREIAVKEATEELADSEVDKFNELIEHVQYESEESFENTISVIKEHYFKQKPLRRKDTSDLLIESGGVQEPEQKSTDSVMDAYESALFKTSKK